MTWRMKNKNPEMAQDKRAVSIVQYLRGKFGHSPVIPLSYALGGLFVASPKEKRVQTESDDLPIAVLDGLIHPLSHIAFVWFVPQL